MRRARPAALLIVAGLLAALLAACDIGGTPAATEPPGTLHVLAGSELKDLEPMLPQVQSATGVNLKFDFVGTLDGAQQIAGGDSHPLAWFSSNRYLSLLQGSKNHVVAQQAIMLSPVVMGVKHSAAQRLGWAGKTDLTWRDIAAASKAGSLRFAMTDPSASNSGFSALAGVASAFSASGAALDSGQIDSAALKDFFTGQKLTAGSSGFLADSFVRSQDDLDGLINYESILLSLNAGGKLHEQLDMLYPKEGIVTADYPLMLLASNGDTRSKYDKVVSYLRSDKVQQQIMSSTARRPSVPTVPLDARFPKTVLVELAFPGSLSVVNNLITAYLDSVRPPSTTTYVLDLSGSMQGDRLDSLKRALDNLTGLDTSVTGSFARFRRREHITIVTFSSQVQDTREFDINDITPQSQDFARLRAYIDGLQAGGGTAIYDAMYQAFQITGKQKAADPNRFYSVVLMTDGESNTGRDGNQFLTDFHGLPEDTQKIKAFTVLLGEASPDQLSQLADLPGGQVFDARKAPLSQIFKQVRGYN
jgi:Ca-activated chloride channel family protein